MTKLLVMRISACLMVIVMVGCGYSHPVGREFDYYAGGPNRAFLMHIAWNRKLCADSNRVAIIGEGIRAQSVAWKEGLNLRELATSTQWKGSSEGDLISATLTAETVFRFGIVGIWRNADGRFEKILRKSNEELANVRLSPGDIVIRLERRICF